MTSLLSDPPEPLGIPVLLVEDDPNAVELMLRCLSRVHLPIMPRVATLLVDAIDLVRDHEYDLVLLDLHLPDSHGVETVSKMAEHHDTIVVMTSAGEELQMQAIKAGADDYLRKDAPVSEVRKALVCALERKLRRRRRNDAVTDTVSTWMRGKLWSAVESLQAELRGRR